MRRTLLMLGLCSAGCFKYSELPNDRPDPKIRTLAEAQILDMQINLHKAPGLCPGHEGKLYVNGTVQWPGMKPVLRSLGNDVDSFDPKNFGISGPLLTGDDQAHLHPDPDVQKSIDDGFVIDVVYRPQSKFKFHDMFPPEYSCFTGSALVGRGGNPGVGGDGGVGGGTGESGGNGSNGGHGGDGETGGHLRAYVTVVATRFYPRLYAVIANDTFYLAPPDRQLTFASIGGEGGPGGQGGPGGNGGDQETRTYERSDGNGGKTTVWAGVGGAGNGGMGGHGGDGGRGGDGGTVEVTYDSAYPELRRWIAVDVRGGAAGGAGAGGGGGNGGGTNATENAQQGHPGNDGLAGRDGQGGREGHASVRPGSVGSMFQSIRGLQLAKGNHR